MVAPLATTALMTRAFESLADRPREVCAILYIGVGQRLVGCRHVVGTVGAVPLSVRTVVADALAFHARAAVIGHNHPSGDAEPSEDDLAFTRALARGLEAVGVALRDHVIVAGATATSLRARGIL